MMIKRITPCYTWVQRPGGGQYHDVQHGCVCFVRPLSRLLKAPEREAGDVETNGASIVDSPRSARLALGVFIAIDTRLVARAVQFGKSILSSSIF